MQEMIYVPFIFIVCFLVRYELLLSIKIIYYQYLYIMRDKVSNMEKFDIRL